MNIQLNSYFQQSLNKHQEIDRKLQPLLNIIKQNKINSVHQLTNQLVNDYSPINQHVLTSIHKISLKKTNLRKFYSQQDKHSLEKRMFSIQNSRGTGRKYSSKSANQNRNVKMIQNDQPLAYRTPNSKAMKHLIQSKRFQSLQTLLNENVRRPNTYKKFIQNLQRKKNESQLSKRKHVSLYKLQKVRLIDNEEAIQIFEQCNNPTEDSLFKVKMRKRFWKRQKIPSKDKVNLSNIMCVKGMKNMAITIQ